MFHDIASTALRTDLALYRAVRGQAVHPAVVKAALAFSHFGEHALGWTAIGAAGTVLDGGRRRQWARATTAVVLAHGGNVAVKRVVRRPRPDLADLPARGRTPSQLSFPSAHAASTFAAATAFAPLLPHAPWRLFAATMALSRVVLGVHYPSDVVAGAALGVAVGSWGHTRAVRPAAQAQAPLRWAGAGTAAAGRAGGRS